MKKVLALILVALMVFSFAACNKDKGGDDGTHPTQAPVNKEELKKGWQEGVLTFANGNTITLPCSIDEIINASGLSIPSLETMKSTMIEPGSVKLFNLVGDGVTVSIRCKNQTQEPVKAEETTIVGYSFNRTKEGNIKLKFANTLTVNAKRAEVEEVLGVDEKAAERKFSKYEGENQKKQKVEMRVSYDSDNFVNSVAFEIK